MTTAISVFAVVFGLVGVVAVFAVYGIVSGAFVLTAMWGWFVTPTFGIAVPPFPIMAGLSALTHYLTYTSPPNYKDHETKFPYLSLLAPWFVLFFAWLIHLWAGNSLGIWGA